MKYFPLRACEYWNRESLNTMQEFVYRTTGKRISIEKLYSEYIEIMEKNILYMKYDELYTGLLELIHNPVRDISKVPRNILSFMHKMFEANKYSQSYHVIDMYDELAFIPTLFAWEKNKQVYKIDETFFDEILKSDNFELSLDEIRHLPYDRFWIDVSNNQRINYIKGVLVEIYKKNDFAYLTLYQIAESGKDEFIRYIHVFKIDDGHPVKSEALAELSDGIECDYIIHDLEKGDHPAIKNTDECNRGKNTVAILQIIKYLSSKEPDIENISSNTDNTVMANKTDKKGNKPVIKTIPKNNMSELNMYEVGFRFGTTFRAYKEQVEHYTKSENAAGRKIRPHYVSAHWHTYRTGKNKSEKIVKWLNPYFTGVDKDKVYDFCNIHRIKLTSEKIC